MAGIIVPDWSKRKLQKGYVWQTYFLRAVRGLTEKAYRENMQGNKKHMDGAMADWQNRTLGYIYERCEELGMRPLKVMASCQDEPDSTKPMEQVIWEARGLAFVWACWGYLSGPIAEEAYSERPLPLENFWPEKVTILDGEIAELIDARLLTRQEQGMG